MEITDPAIVVTSVNAPNAAMRQLAAGSVAYGRNFIVIGDTKSSPSYDLPGCRFFSIADQISTGFATAAQCPTRHYARKNVGYLLAMRDGAPLIIETDDDNFPRPEFFSPRNNEVDCVTSNGLGWVNVYRYFTDTLIWPRGLPLDAIHSVPEVAGDIQRRFSPIQQGLADGDPDVDAIFRLVLPLPLTFDARPPVALPSGAWCPFNSQNTAWWPTAYPLLYLPAYCSFRMTDIWRSFVAQRIAWENGWSILFHSATVWQDRNKHDLMRDFADEVPGYLNNRAIGEALQALDLQPGSGRMADNLRSCYRLLVKMKIVDEAELLLLDAWLADIAMLGCA